MATLYVSNAPETEQKQGKPDYSLIETVQNRSKLLESGIDERNPAIRQGDRAFAKLLNRYNGWLWKQVYAAADLDPDETYSAALQGFEKAIATFDLSTGYALATHAYHCVRTAITALRRKIKGQLKKAQAVADKLALRVSTAPDYSEAQEQREQTTTRVYELIEQLSPSDQQIVLLHDEAGKKFVEICELVGRTYDAVRAAYRRAIKFILGHLHPQPSPQSAEVEASEVNLDTPPVESIPEKGWMALLWERFKSGVRFLQPSAISNSPRPSCLPTENSNDLSTKPFTAFDGRSSPQAPDEEELYQAAEFAPDEVSHLAGCGPGDRIPIAGRTGLHLRNLWRGWRGLPPAQRELEIHPQKTAQPRHFWARCGVLLGLSDDSRSG